MKIYYRDLRAYKYELAETLSLQTGVHPIGPEIKTEYISLTRDGFLSIARGYAWDGPSGPAIDTPNFMRGSLVHDALYQLIRMGMLPMEKRASADRLLYRLIQEDGMSQIRAAWVYSGVRAAGWASCSPRAADRASLKEAP